MTDQPSTTLHKAARLHRHALCAGVLLAVAVAAAACGPNKPAGLSSGEREPAAVPKTSGGPLMAPKTSPAQDGQYFTYLAEADPGLSTYVQAQGNVALRALLTDGSAFCAFLARGGGVDDAMASVVIGAKSVQAQTHLPPTVRTFNAIDAVSLLALCPSELRLVPATDRTRIRALGNALAHQPQSGAQ
jgi:hypothetical protein